MRRTWGFLGDLAAMTVVEGTDGSGEEDYGGTVFLVLMAVVVVKATVILGAISVIKKRCIENINFVNI